MSIYNAIIIGIAAFTFTVSLYFFLQVIFVYKTISNINFLFALGTFFAGMYIIFQYLYLNAGDQQLLIYARLKMLSISLAGCAWITYIYRLNFSDTMLIKIIWVFTILPILCMPSDLYVSGPIRTVTIHIFNTAIQYRLPHYNILYILQSLIMFGLCLAVVVKILLAKSEIGKKLISLFFMFPLIGALNDFLFSHQYIETIFMTELLFFITIISVFVSYFREERSKNLKIANMNTLLEIEVALRTEELIEANEKLKNLDIVKNDFIANITHDFRSPLTVILNIADLSLKNEGYRESRDEFEMIFRSSLKLKHSIDRLLELAKMDAQGLVLKIRKINLIAFLGSVVSYYTSALVNSRIKIESRAGSLESVPIYIDTDKLDEVLNNIISNAIKFSKPEGGTIELRVDERPDSVVIMIADDGIGIPPDKLDVVFNRFEQLQEGRNAAYGGTGIGLAFSKQLIEYMHGSIWAESAGSGRGATFYIEMKKGKEHFGAGDIVDEKNGDDLKMKHPALLSPEIQTIFRHDEVIVLYDDLNKEDEYDYKKGKILIIDDEEVITKIVMDYLKLNGYKNFIVTNSGKMGLTAIFERDPDIIICDYNMPEIKGDEIHDKMLNNPKFQNIPFIFLSAVTDNRLVVERRQKGAFAYLKKPIDERELVLTVDLHLKKYFEYIKTYQLASIDELTNLYNRREVLKRFSEELAIRRYRDISVIFFDVDSFKRINDLHGHQCGDLVLKKIGAVLKNTLRGYDIPGRYGGDEFIVILPETGIENAGIVAENIGKRVSSEKIDYGGDGIAVTLSVGISSLIDNEDYIRSQLSMNDLKDVFDGRPRDGRDWQKDDDYRKVIAQLLINMADISLYRAKTTRCKACDYRSVAMANFADNLCPRCNSADLDIGKNRICLFKSEK